AGLLDGSCRRIGRHHDQIHFQPDQLRGDTGKPLVPPLCVSEFDDEVLALDVTQLAQSLLECLVYGCLARIAGGQDSDLRFWLLRLRGVWRSQGTSQRGQQEAAAVHHSMISSARSSSEGGIVRPRALAVCRLTISLKTVGRWIGSSAGLVPL